MRGAHRGKGVGAISSWAMTAREKLLKQVTRLSEAEADETLRLLEAWRKGANVDEWGDLDAWGDAVSRSAFRELDEEEARIGFSWEKSR